MFSHSIRENVLKFFSLQALHIVRHNFIISIIERSSRIFSPKHLSVSEYKHSWLLWNQYCQLKDTTHNSFFPSCLVFFYETLSFAVKRIFKMLIYFKNTTKPQFFPLIHWHKGSIFILVLTCLLFCIFFDCVTLKEKVSS